VDNDERQGSRDGGIGGRVSGREHEIDELNRKVWNEMLSRPEESLATANNVLSLSEAEGYRKGRADALLNIGWCEHYLTQSGPALRSFQQALDSYTDLDDSLGIIKTLNAFGTAYFNLGRYDRAMDFYTRSLEDARKAGNRWREAVTLSNIGEVCLDLGEHKEALDYFLRAYETIPDDSESELVSNILLNIGTTFRRMENWVLAKEFTEKALAICQESQNLQLSAQCWLSLGRIACASDERKAAEGHFLKALDAVERLKNEKVKAETLLELGTVQVLESRPSKALERYNAALASAEHIGSKALINQAYERLSEAYELLKDYRTALDYYRRYARYEREVLSEDTTRKIKNVTVQYEVEKSRQEAEIYRLRNYELRQKTEELEEANRQILSISELGRRITSSLDFDNIISTLYESLKSHMDVTVFGIALHDEVDDTLEWRVFMENGKRLHRPIKKLEYGKSFAAWCVQNRKSIFVTDAEKDSEKYVPEGRTSLGKPAVGLIFVPLLIEERVIGILTIQSYEKDSYTESHRILLEALSPYLAIAIENSLIHDRVEELNRSIIGEKEELEQAAMRSSHLANHDALTGLPNRRLLFELLQKSFDIASRSHTKVGVIYMDLDNFKPINDRFGHLAGDSALITISARLRSILRASDTVARVGGDEFIAVLTNIHDREAIELAAQKILEECSRPIPLDSEECTVGVSMGIAVYPDDGEVIADLVNRSDTAMYRIKHEGKGTYTFFAPEDSPPFREPPANEPLA